MQQLDLLQKELQEALDKAKEASQESAEGKSSEAFKNISEVAEVLDVPQHVLRFWESRFPQIKPLKMRGGRRYYRPADVEALSTIKQLLYKHGYTIKGARKAFNQFQHAKPDEAQELDSAPLSERQKSQLSVIRQELVGLRNLLKEYL